MPGIRRSGGAPLAPMFRVIYYFYGRRLARDVKSRPTPRHVGIILDGNRRHGRSLGITKPRELYDIGANKLDEVLEWCAELGIPTVTLWVFSTENFHRPAAEDSGILEIHRGQADGARLRPGDPSAAGAGPRDRLPGNASRAGARRDRRRRARHLPV